MAIFGVVAAGLVAIVVGVAALSGTPLSERFTFGKTVAVVDVRGVISDAADTVDGTVEIAAEQRGVPSAPPVGLRLDDIERCDYVLVGHSHFDHLWGADRIATQTGATVVGSYESVRMLVDAGVPNEKVVAVAGGEPLQLGEGIRARVFPSLHTCLWCLGFSDAPPTTVATGDLGVPQHERDRRLGEMLTGWGEQPEILEHLLSAPHARGDGGPLVYLIETPDGSILWQDSAGSWSALLRGLHPDIALLAAVGRPNQDGRPNQERICSRWPTSGRNASRS